MHKLKVFVLTALAVAIPAATYLWVVRHVPPSRTLPEPAAHIGSRFPPSPLSFERREIGPLVKPYPLITNVQIVDLDQDGDRDLVVSVLGDLYPNDEVVDRIKAQRAEVTTRHPRW